MPDIDLLVQNMEKLADDAARLSEETTRLTEQILNFPGVLHTDTANSGDPFIFSFTIFVLACFIGYHVVWKVTPSLHTPLMSITNAISSIVIIGAILAATATTPLASQLGLFAILLASINIFGGFVVTQRMLKMFKKKERS